jgi:hypothetical protein
MNEATAKTFLARSLREYMEATWKPIKKSSHIRLFRGQGRDWNLLPKLFRLKDKSVEELEEIEQKLIGAFKNASPYLLPSAPSDDWEWLSVGQHYGLYTRLLDWSVNPLIGLYFAVEETNCKGPVVWIYETASTQIVAGEKRKQSPFEIKQTWVLEPRRHSMRVTSQAGWHTVHRFHPTKTTKQRRVLSLNSMELHEKRLRKIYIDQQSAGHIRDELREIGIHGGTVYSDLAALCRSICDQFDVGPT